MSWVPRSQSELAYIGGSTKLPVVSMVITLTFFVCLKLLIVACLLCTSTRHQLFVNVGVCLVWRMAQCMPIPMLLTSHRNATACQLMSIGLSELVSDYS